MLEGRDNTGGLPRGIGLSRHSGECHIDRGGGVQRVQQADVDCDRGESDVDRGQRIQRVPSTDDCGILWEIRSRAVVGGSVRRERSVGGAGAMEVPAQQPKLLRDEHL